MGTAIDRPYRNPSSNPIRPRRRKRSPVGFQDNNNNNNNIKAPNRNQLQDETMIARLRAKNLVMGQVKILKHGEEVNSNSKDAATKTKTTNRSFGGDDDLALSSTDRLGPEPETVQKQIRVSDLKVADGIYAGSAFFTSPPPSSLPFPAFFGKKEKSFDSATSDLRRLLRLDLL